MTNAEKILFWAFVALITVCLIYFLSDRPKLQYPTYQPKSQEHYEKLYAEGWRWHEGKGIYVRGNKIYPALYGGYFRKEHVVEIGLDNGSTFLKVSDPNTGEPIKLKYGENILYPTLIWDNGQSINSFSLGDISVNEDWDKSAWKDWNLPEEGNVALYGDREYRAQYKMKLYENDPLPYGWLEMSEEDILEYLREGADNSQVGYRAILRHGPYDFPEADPNDYAKFLDRKITFYDGEWVYDISGNAPVTVR